MSGEIGVGTMSDKEYMSDEEYVANIPNLSNEKLIDGLISCGHDSYYNVMYYPIVDEIRKRLSKERKKGKWVVHDYAFGRERYEYTECRGRCDLEYNFCPNCGAEMMR
jgi:hypothetical protein